jgi:hypothetical protein
MTNTPTAADVAAAERARQAASRAMLDAARPLEGLRVALAVALEAGAAFAPESVAADLAACDAAIAASDAAIAASEAAISLYERTPPDVFAAGMRFAFDAARGEA